MSAAVPQHMVALAKANEVQSARSRAKKDLAAGRLTVGEALELECCQTMTVERLLTSQRWWGPTRAAGLLRALEWKRVFIGPGVAVGRLTDRQRTALAEACAGIVIQADGGQSGNLRVLCDGEHAGEREAEVETEITRAVGVSA